MREEVQDYVIEVSAEANKKDSSEKLDKLLEGKKQPKIAFLDVHCMMSDATNMEELGPSGRICQRFTGK